MNIDRVMSMDEWRQSLTDDGHPQFVREHVGAAGGSVRPPVSDAELLVIGCCGVFWLGCALRQFQKWAR